MMCSNLQAWESASFSFTENVSVSRRSARRRRRTVSRTGAAALREGEFAFAHGEKAERFETRDDARCVLTCGALADLLDRRRDALFAEDPNLLEQVIEVNFILGGIFGDLREAAVREFDTAVGEAANFRCVRDHQDGVALRVQLTEELDDGGFVRGVEVAGGLVG
jgi:hypothetical protein